MIETLGTTEHSDSVDHSTLATKSVKVMAGCDDGSIAKLFNNIQPGSLEAKKVWAGIDADCHSASNVAKAKALSGSEKAVGMFAGKPLVPGVVGDATHPQGDFAFLKNKLMWNNGYSEDAATRICSSIKNKLYGNH